MKVNAVFLSLLSVIASVYSLNFPLLDWFVHPSTASSSNLRGSNGGAKVLTVYNFFDVPILVHFTHKEDQAVVDIPNQDDVSPSDDDDTELEIMWEDVFYDDFDESDLSTAAEESAPEFIEIELEGDDDDAIEEQDWKWEWPYSDYYAGFVYDDDYWATWDTPPHRTESDGHDDTYYYYGGRGYVGADDDWYVDDDWVEDWWAPLSANDEW